MTAFDNIPGLKAQLDEVSDRARAIALELPPREPLTQVLDFIFSVSGKQLRPALLLLFGRAGRRYPDCERQLLTAGAVIELTHMASLIHDDIVDVSPTRRGRATLQSEFGKDMAVYGGDYLLSLVLTQLLCPDMLEPGQVLAKSISDMCGGELGQYAAQFDVQTDENRYFTNISGKTAALFSAACRMGALISGWSLEELDLAEHFGHSFGMIFQLRDDLIDCVPNSSDDGKKHGMDFINGVYTLPVLYSFKDPEHGPRLRALAENATSMAPDKLSDELYKHISAAGGIDYTRRVIKRHRDSALDSIAQMPYARLREQLTALLDEIMD